jgi:hypothetical protein
MPRRVLDLAPSPRPSSRYGADRSLRTMPSSRPSAICSAIARLHDERRQLVGRLEGTRQKYEARASLAPRQAGQVPRLPNTGRQTPRTAAHHESVGCHAGQPWWNGRPATSSPSSAVPRHRMGSGSARPSQATFEGILAQPIAPHAQSIAGLENLARLEDQQAAHAVDLWLDGIGIRRGDRGAQGDEAVIWRRAAAAAWAPFPPWYAGLTGGASGPTLRRRIRSQCIVGTVW